jgi:hypothetical protein
MTGHPRSAQAPTSGRPASDGQSAKADAQTSGATCNSSCRLQGELDVWLRSGMRDSFCGDPLGDLLGQEAALSLEPDPVAGIRGGRGLLQEGRKTRCERMVGRPNVDPSADRAAR